LGQLGRRSTPSGKNGRLRPSRAWLRSSPISPRATTAESRDDAGVR
jgi:hypothetical protein